MYTKVGKSQKGSTNLTENGEWYGLLLYAEQNIYTSPIINKNNHIDITIQLRARVL